MDELFKQYEDLKWEFTYGHEDDPELHNALQVGLVAYFYLDQAWTPERRQAMADALAFYHQHMVNISNMVTVAILISRKPIHRRL